MRATRTVYENPWLRVREDDVVFADGRPGIYGVVDKPNFAVVLPYEDSGFWLVEQYRYPVLERSWEFPLGAWPAGESGTLRELAIAELREETGKHAGSLTLLGSLYSAPGTQSNHYEVYLAEDLTSGDTEREATESDMVCEWRSEVELHAMIAQGRFRDAQSVAAFALFLLNGRHQS